MTVTDQFFRKQEFMWWHRHLKKLQSGCFWGMNGELFFESQLFEINE